MPSKNLTIGIASGKGGVGKSMVASSLAMLFSREKNIVAVDADVDAPNLHLWLGGITKWDEVKELSLTEKANLLKPDFDCRKFDLPCHFGAIKCQNNQITINPFLCEGCGLCQEILPEGMIEMKKVVNGRLRVKKDIFGFPLVSGRLYPGQTGSGKIVDEIINRSPKFSAEITLVDIPAGLGCPVTAGLKEADLVLLITEPTPTGWSDLKRIKQVVDNFNVPWRLIINKFDLNEKFSKGIVVWAGKNYLGKISYNKNIFKSLSRLEPIIESNLETKKELKKIFDSFLSWINTSGF